MKLVPESPYAQRIRWHAANEEAPYVGDERDDGGHYWVKMAAPEIAECYYWCGACDAFTFAGSTGFFDSLDDAVRKQPDCRPPLPPVPTESYPGYG